MKNKTIIRLFLFVFLFFVISLNVYKQYDIKKNSKNSIGKIIKFEKSGKSNFNLIYEYFVDGNRYTGQTGIDPFICDDGTKNAIGKQFKVYYSSKNPENSRIDLGKYEKFKTTVEFVK